VVSRANGNFTEAAVLMGGAGNDTITSANTKDALQGGDDNDTLIWNPGKAATPSKAATASTRCSSMARTPTRS
jgi:hypothetical protein